MSAPLSTPDRREFLKSSTLAAAGLIAPSLFVGGAVAQDAPSDALNVGVIGLGRGMAHVNTILGGGKAKLSYVCDVDQLRLERGMKTIEAKGAPAPTPVQDFRRLLDDPKLDAVFIATCNHWHAPATILACAANKHVYVEKPGSHNAREGELMVAAARKHKRTVQMGNQRRSYPAIIEAIGKLREGAIGNILYARCWYNSARESIGRGKPAPVPATLDYSLWQGPAPERPYVDNLVHYNWHWRWHWGGGEMANNGIHSLDVARWGLDVEYPTKVSFFGGRYHFDDDQETPDTATAVFHFGNKGCTWEGSSCHPRRGDKTDMVVFYGTEGSLHIEHSGGYRIHDFAGKELSKAPGKGNDLDHVGNFFECIRSGKTPNSEIEIGQKSTLLCHLANISYKTGRVINLDPETHKIVGDREAEKLWTREYRPGWEPKV